MKRIYQDGVKNIRPILGVAFAALFWPYFKTLSFFSRYDLDDWNNWCVQWFWDFIKLSVLLFSKYGKNRKHFFYQSGKKPGRTKKKVIKTTLPKALAMCRILEKWSSKIFIYLVKNYTCSTRRIQLESIEKQALQIQYKEKNRN